MAMDNRSWGVSVAVMALAWLVVAAVCGLVCIVLLGVFAPDFDYSYPSTGGMVGLVAAIVIGCMYHSASIGSVGGAAGAACVVGAILGVLAVLV